MENLKRRKRSDNWLEEDRELLKLLVLEREAAIENKNTDTCSNHEKKKAWLELQQRFNSVCEGKPRDVCQLKCQWVSIKVLEKKAARCKRELSVTSEESSRPLVSETSEESPCPLKLTVLSPNEANERFFKLTQKIKKKRKRSDNWIEEDKTLLKELVKERMAAIENKNTDSLSNQRKKKAWLDLEKRFNSLCEGEPRKVYQLKSQWTTLKIQARKLVSEQRNEFYQQVAEQNNDVLQTNGEALRAINMPVKMPVVKQTVATNKLKILVDLELRNREELHALQMENERKRGRNLDLEYEILLNKKMIYQRNLNDND